MPISTKQKSFNRKSHARQEGFDFVKRKKEIRLLFSKIYSDSNLHSIKLCVEPIKGESAKCVAECKVEINWKEEKDVGGWNEVQELVGSGKDWVSFTQNIVQYL